MTHSQNALVVVGSGLAGSQAALTIANLGGRVDLYEMRPRVTTPAHRTAHAAELVCSNSLRSNEQDSAPGLLKEELRRLGCELLQCADESAIPGGTALAVDREQFSRTVTELLRAHPLVRLYQQEIDEVPQDRICILATGPLTSDALVDSIQGLTGESNLFFHDAIPPVIDANSVDRSRLFWAARHGRGENGFLNCPLTREEYLRFRHELVAAEGVFKHGFDELKFFGCPPLEALARSGADTLRYGPLKPIGLPDPRTGHVPYAVVQLRQENLRSESFNLVGFQNQLKFSEQERVFRLIPGLEKAEFLRFGQMHRNTYVRAPALLDAQLNLKTHPDLFLAGQLCGVEGYVEAMATGLVAGINAWRRSQQLPLISLPRVTAIGSLCHYLAFARSADFAPVRFTFDLLPRLEDVSIKKRAQRRTELSLRALAALNDAEITTILAPASLSQQSAKSNGEYKYSSLR